MSIECRNYDEELKALLDVAKESSVLVDSYYTTQFAADQTVSLQWVTTQTSSKEAEDADT